jgi:hypothetical protein
MKPLESGTEVQKEDEHVTRWMQECGGTLFPACWLPHGCQLCIKYFGSMEKRVTCGPGVRSEKLSWRRWHGSNVLNYRKGWHAWKKMSIDQDVRMWKCLVLFRVLQVVGSMLLESGLSKWALWDESRLLKVVCSDVWSRTGLRTAVSTPRFQCFLV